MAKKIVSEFILHIPAGKANPAPPIGTALGQRGLNIMEFCKAFNAATQGKDAGAKIPTKVTAYQDKSFTFKVSEPTVTFLLMQAANIKKGSGEVGKVAPIAKITKAQLESIAQRKQEDLNAHTIDAACNIIAGSASSMGIEIVD